MDRDDRSETAVCGRRGVALQSARAASFNALLPRYMQLRVTYIDVRDVNWNDLSITVTAACAQGWNFILLSFWMGGVGAVDATLVWMSSPAANRAAALSYCHARGAIVGVAAGGATDSPYATSAASYGSRAAAFVLAAGLDALDFVSRREGGGWGSCMPAGGETVERGALLIKSATTARQARHVRSTNVCHI